MNNLNAKHMVRLLLLITLTTLVGCGSEGGPSAGPGVDSSASADAGLLDARKTLHLGELKDAKSISSSTTSIIKTPYVVVGCYSFKNLKCKSQSGADVAPPDRNAGICFEKNGSNYFLHQIEWKYAVNLSSDGRQWSSSFREKDDTGFYHVDITSPTVTSNHSMDNFEIKLAHTNMDSCGKKMSQMECTASLSFESDSYMETLNKKYDESQFMAQTCQTPETSEPTTSGPSQQPVIPVLQKWVKQTSGVTNNLSAVAYGNGKYVSVGDGGIVLTSADAKVWTQSAKLGVIGLEAVVFWNGKFVTGGWGSMFVSSDGIKWDLIKDTPLFVEKIIRTDTLFVAVGLYSGTNGVITSTDGVVWSKLQNGNGIFLTQIAYGANTFIAVGAKGEVVKSTDGISWVAQKSPTSNSIYNLAYGNKAFLITDSSSKVYTSIDNGVTWIQQSNPSPYLSPIIYNNGKFVGAGFQYVYESPDGEKWTQVTEDIQGDVEDIIYDGSRYVAVGWSGLILTSK